MKLEVDKSTFKPVKLTIVLENQEEFDTLVLISGYNATVATAVNRGVSRAGNSLNIDLAENILGDIYHELVPMRQS